MTALPLPDRVSSVLLADGKWYPAERETFAWVSADGTVGDIQGGPTVFEFVSNGRVMSGPSSSVLAVWREAEE